ncbi:hypothetical protein POTOM_022434 [Populus tomentosa]|uniref:Enoyl reductase (ER) domain-containing protein n=1 Tax=Populus tomentosa TaxID=118781 RepID=A0A8X7ZHM9_POPTO|nr:hypothetical protein POTOM_022434 [Populus tomentosa]
MASDKSEDCLGGAARDESGVLSPYEFNRSDNGIENKNPMIRHKMNSLGVIGLGGLGHLAVKSGEAFGLNVTVFSTSISKNRGSLDYPWSRQLRSLLRQGANEGLVEVDSVALLAENLEMTSDNSGNCLAWAARDKSGFLSPYTFNRSGTFGKAIYPVVPGHEIVGIVQEVGSEVQSFKVGDHVGVGAYVNSCRDCEYCNDDLEIHCSNGVVVTFNGLDEDGTVTKGGYSTPLLCAGITVYAPMIRHKMNQPGKSLGVIGLGGLGHLAVKFGKAFGLNVTVFSTSMSKKEEALNLLGADNFVVSSDKEQMKALDKSLDFIIDTASGDHPFDPYMSILKTAGILVLVGAPSEIKLAPLNLIFGMRTLTGSATGGTKQTQEMLDFCGAHKIYPEVEVIPIQYANEALERLIKKDVKYRFVIDIENSLN